MKVFRFLGKLFPRSFTAKVFFLSFCSTHVPLLTLVAYVPVTSAELSRHLEALAVVVIASLVATAATFLSLKAVLSPIYEIERAMQDLEEKGAIEAFHLDSHDELGRLMQRTVRTVKRLNVRIQSTEREAETEPRRVWRRLILVSYAAMVSVFRAS